MNLEPDELALLHAWREDDVDLRVPETPLGSAINRAVDAVLEAHSA